jgi:hypothetical protein
MGSEDYGYIYSWTKKTGTILVSFSEEDSILSNQGGHLGTSCTHSSLHLAITRESGNLPCRSQHVHRINPI